MCFKGMWKSVKKKRHCDILLVDTGDNYCAHFGDAEKLHHDFDFCDILVVKDRVIFAAFPKCKISSVIDYYKNLGVKTEILSEGK